MTIGNPRGSELRQQLLCTLSAVAKKAVQGEANRFVVRGVYRSAAETLDGLHSEGYGLDERTWMLSHTKTFSKHGRVMNVDCS
jgi:hypothetical protein